jgi:hypothetical protein
VPDVNSWIGNWDGRPDWVSPEHIQGGNTRLANELKLIVGSRMETRREQLPSPKVDILNISPLVSSASKKVIIHVHARPTLARLWNLPWRLRAIAGDVKNLLGLPKDEQCVSVNFKPVLKRFWAKA